MAIVINKQDLPGNSTARKFEGYLHGEVNISFFLSDTPPEHGPALHTHAYEEVFIVLEGKLTFTVLGVSDPGLEVKLVPVVTQTWTHEPKYIEDPLLKPGQEKEVEKGGKGFRSVTTKIVMRDGVEVSRETFKSYYKGGPKIIARGPVVVPPIELPAVIDPRP